MQPGTKYPYLSTHLPTYLPPTYPSPASNRKKSILSKLATHFARRSRNSPTVEMIYHHFYELHWSLHMRDFPRFSSYAVTCTFICTLRSFLLYIQNILHSTSLFSSTLPILLHTNLLVEKKIWNKINLFNYNTEENKLILRRREII